MFRDFVEEESGFPFCFCKSFQKNEVHFQTISYSLVWYILKQFVTSVKVDIFAERQGDICRFAHYLYSIDWCWINATNCVSYMMQIVRLR